MGGEATPGLGAPEDEELLGRVSSDRALCMPGASAEPLLPPPCYSTSLSNMLQSCNILTSMTDRRRHRQTCR